MYCEDCPRFDPERRTCRDGKVNPQRWDLTVEVANVFGVRSICMFNDYRERLVASRSRTLPVEPEVPAQPPA